MNQDTMHTPPVFTNTELENNNEKELINTEEQAKSGSRHFGLADIWNIRRGTKSFKIHDRIPRI